MQKGGTDFWGRTVLSILNDLIGPFLQLSISTCPNLLWIGRVDSSLFEPFHDGLLNLLMLLLIVFFIIHFEFTELTIDLYRFSTLILVKTFENSLIKQISILLHFAVGVIGWGWAIVQSYTVVRLTLHKLNPIKN